MFKFTIRDLLLLTLIVALAAGWWISWHASRADRLAWKQRAETFEKILIHRGYDVEVRYSASEIRIRDGDETVIYPITKDLETP